ncbi:MAG: polysaccharide deacetylase family protein [Prolixibacteraceae bacterium]|nr:polysaccharide deacetylase family protein [Prolixibacteraceae bacterium]MBN2774881.1 polysaccharide deacetylase family protein [Prolixibacteraceae bacterium]
MKDSINNLCRKIAFVLIRVSGIPFLFRNLIQKNKVTILLFHDISVQTADKTFRYLSKKYNFISLQYFLNAVKNTVDYPLPKKALIITFDDGFKQNYELKEIFKKYKIPVTIFICAWLVNTKRHFWFERNTSNYSLEELKKMSNSKRLKILEKAGFNPLKEYNSTQVLSKTQIENMKDIVDFQSHTLTHPCLPNCSDSVAMKEIFESKLLLEQRYNLKINALAYPNGDYSERDIQFAKESGYTCGLTVDYGFNNINTDLFLLKRLCVNDTDNMNELIVKASGFWDFVKTRNGRNQNSDYNYIEN